MMPFFHKLIFHKLNSFTVFSVTDILQCKRATSLAHSLIVLVQFLASAEIVSLGFLVIVVFNWLMVFTFLMWCAICCNVFCDIFLAGFAETRKNRQNYLCALARCSHSWGDLQTSFSVHASQWGNLLSRAYSAHPQVFRSRGKTFCMVMATEPMHKMVVLKLKSRVIQVSFHGSFQNGMCRGWSHKRDCLTAHYDFCVSAQKTEYRCCGVFFTFTIPIRVLLPEKGPLPGWASVRSWVASLGCAARRRSGKWRQVSSAAWTIQMGLPRDLLHLRLWWTASDWRRRGTIVIQHKGIARDSLVT